MRVSKIIIRHWLPIISFCPVNKLPDPIYVSVFFEDKWVELYDVRKRIRKVASMKKVFMEDIAVAIMREFPNASAVEVRLWFSRHVVRIENK